MPESTAAGTWRKRVSVVGSDGPLRSVTLPAPLGFEPEGPVLVCGPVRVDGAGRHHRTLQCGLPRHGAGPGDGPDGARPAPSADDVLDAVPPRRDRHYCWIMRRSASGTRASARLAALPLWLRRLVGNSVALLVLLLVMVPFYVVIALVADFLVNHSEADGPLPWLHAAAVPAEVIVVVLVMGLAVAFLGYLFAVGVAEVRNAARRIVGGRWTDGLVTSLDHEETDSDGDVRRQWRVQFADEAARVFAVGFVSYGFSGKKVVEGTTLRVRYQVADPGNAVAVHAGAGPRLSHWLTGWVIFGLWVAFIASIPVGLLVAGVLWVTRQR